MTRLIKSVSPYLLLNAASQLFEKVPADLDEKQWWQAAELAEKEQKLQQNILDAPEAASVSVSESELAHAKGEIEGRYPDRKSYLEDLARNGLNEETLADALENSLKMEKTVSSVADAAGSVPEEEIVAYYNEHLEKFSHPELRQARHILITFNNQYPENRRKAVTDRMARIEKELQASPEKFADLAMRHSECPTALEGGKLGKLPRGKLYPELDEVLFAMNEGEISQPVESPIGLHILLCEAIYPAGTAPFEEAKEKICQHLERLHRHRVQKAWIQKLLHAAQKHEQ